MPKTITEYINAEPKVARPHAKKMRAIIRKALPGCEEALKWGMPTFMLNKENIVLFGAFKAHIGFFAGVEVTRKFKKEIAKYKTSKATIQFPYDKPLPAALITRITKYAAKS